MCVDGNASDLQNLMQLQAMKKQDQQACLEAFGLAVRGQARGQMDSQSAGAGAGQDNQQSQGGPKAGNDQSERVGVREDV